MNEHADTKENGATNIEHQPAIIGEKNATNTEQRSASIEEGNATNTELVESSVMPYEQREFCRRQCEYQVIG